MVLQPIAQTLTLREIRVLHLEPTDVCQAACPQCARETDVMFDKNKKHHLSVSMLQQMLPSEFVSGLDKMFMCGNYGDPAAGAHTMAIYEWFRSQNNDIILGMNTNGAIGTASWWRSLAQILCQPRDYVVFSIDGLEDTNSMYRVNVNWSKLMANAEAFIAAGGSAHWDMLVYQHNQHQVDICENLARKMGFRWFRAKVSKRALVGELQAPIGWQPSQAATASIDCHALKEQSIYIDAQGRISPCCWLGSRQIDFVTDFEAVRASWRTSTPVQVCAATCGKGSTGTVFENQWRKEIQLC